MKISNSIIKKNLTCGKLFETSMTFGDDVELKVDELFTSFTNDNSRSFMKSSVEILEKSLTIIKVIMNNHNNI
jgi:hypothetical protein